MVGKMILSVLVLAIAIYGVFGALTLTLLLFFFCSRFSEFEFVELVAAAG